MHAHTSYTLRKRAANTQLRFETSSILSSTMGGEVGVTAREEIKHNLACRIYLTLSWSYRISGSSCSYTRSQPYLPHRILIPNRFLIKTIQIIISTNSSNLWRVT
jgi:hypothetical protein